jgi:hypothetical protein
MSDYTPTTEEIRDYVGEGGEPRPWIAPDDDAEKEAARLAAFDRWLRTERANAWDAGVAMALEAARPSTTMNDYDGWREITCAESSEIRNAAPHVLSSLTDLTGQFGRPVVYTEWGNDDGATLRDYLWNPHREGTTCAHSVPDEEATDASA